MFNILYKLTATGAIQQWQIFTNENSYWTEHGQVGGVITKTLPTKCKRKNVGKINETTEEQQAVVEACSKYEKKIKEGYKENINDIYDYTFYEPMLAHKWEKYKDKIKFPLYSQPKFDGCVDGNTELDTKEFGKLKISDIVNNNIKCSVKSFNTDTGKFEYKEVVHKFLNKKVSENIQWYKITTESGENITLTGNHLVYLPDLLCWRRVDQLIGDENLMVY